MKPTKVIPSRAPSAPARCPCGALQVLVTGATLIMVRCADRGHLLFFHRIRDELYERSKERDQ